MYRSYRDSPIWRAFLIAVVTLLTALLSLHIFFRTQKDGFKFPSICSNDERGLGTPRTFTNRPEFYDLSPAGDELWTSILPKNMGFIPQVKNGKTDIVGVTMFHQLHCLQMVRSAIQDLQREPKHSSHQARHEAHDHDMEGSGHDTKHWSHCLDYLMQGILCAADDTFEPYIMHEGKGFINGYGVTHICRDPMKLWTMDPEEHGKPPYAPE